MDDSADIVIVGAGAAGLAAGIFAGEAARELGTGVRIVALDGAKSIGAKILVSGGGRCNVTHERIALSDYNGSRNIVRNILAAFDERATVEWFASLGVRLKTEETGKVFPVSDQARTVLEALLGRCRELGVEVRTEHRVGDIQRQNGEFLIQHSRGMISARRLIVSTGGRSLPKTGSDGAGWEMLQELGHSVTSRWPALVPLVLDSTFIHPSLSGIALPVELGTFANGKVIDRRVGDLLWTHFGISGPVVMDASRHFIGAQHRGEEAELRCNLLPGEGFESMERRLSAQTGTVGRVLERLPERVAAAVAEMVGLQLKSRLSQLTREQRRALGRAVVELKLPVMQDRGWNYAEVTAGGVPLAEIDFRTMQSRKVANLYLAGELLDCDGRIGGFNFQWAWATGFLAGRAAVGSLKSEVDR